MLFETSGHETSVTMQHRTQCGHPAPAKMIFLHRESSPLLDESHIKSGKQVGESGQTTDRRTGGGAAGCSGTGGGERETMRRRRAPLRAVICSQDPRMCFMHQLRMCSMCLLSCIVAVAENFGSFVLRACPQKVQCLYSWLRFTETLSRASKF